MVRIFPFPAFYLLMRYNAFVFLLGHLGRQYYLAKCDIKMIHPFLTQDFNNRISVFLPTANLATSKRGPMKLLNRISSVRDPLRA